MVNRSIEEFTYTNKEIADELYKAMNATQFLGVSVRLCSFDVGKNALVYKDPSTNFFFSQARYVLPFDTI